MAEQATNVSDSYASPGEAEGRPWGIVTALRSPRVASWVRLGAFVVILLSLLAVAAVLPRERVGQLLMDWIAAAGIWGPVAFILLYIIFTVLMLPGSILTILAGALFGMLWGTVTVSIGSTLGVAAAFLMGRYVARDAVAKKVQSYPRFAAIDRAVAEDGWKIVALLRLSPAVPFNLQNYVYGLTAIRFWPAVIASWVAMLPGTFLYVYLGRAFGLALLRPRELTTAEWVFFGVGLLLTVAVTVYITRLARRAIARQSTAAREVAATEKDTLQEDSSPPRSNLPGTLALAALALVMLGGAACAYLNADRIRGLFDPPSVVMVERYEPRPDGPTFDHSGFDAILKQYVNDNGGVDYAGLIANPDELLAYNRTLAEAPWDALGRNEKLALLINAYNSFTLELMVEWLPREDIDGIRDIPAARRWDDERWNIGGNVWSLNQIEHEQIRPNFIEPRIHWAVVCAAVGCPPLRQEAYVGDRVDEQLAEQERIIHTDGSRWYRFDADEGVVHLSQLYNWYGGDFEQVAGSVMAYVCEHAPEVDDALRQDRRLRIEWLRYDWSLNDQENLP